MGVVRYLATMLGLGILATTVMGLVEGHGLSGAVMGLFGFLWVGWIGLLAGLPLLLVFLALLPRATGAQAQRPVTIVAAALSASIWGAAGLLLMLVAVAVGSFTPNPPLVVAGQGLAYAALLAVVGAVVGFIEGLAWRRQPA